jgi:hypothetical protein
LIHDYGESIVGIVTLDFANAAFTEMRTHDLALEGDGFTVIGTGAFKSNECRGYAVTPSLQIFFCQSFITDQRQALIFLLLKGAGEI